MIHEKIVSAKAFGLTATRDLRTTYVMIPAFALTQRKNRLIKLVYDCFSMATGETL